MKTKIFVARAGSGKSTYATQKCIEFENKGFYLLHILKQMSVY